MEKLSISVPNHTIEKALRQFPGALEITINDHASASLSKTMPVIPLTYKVVHEDKLYFSNLQILILSNTFVESIENLSFSAFENLKKLDLSLNFITLLHAFAKVNVPNLNDLTPSSNAFASLKALERMSATKMAALKGALNGGMIHEKYRQRWINYLESLAKFEKKERLSTEEQYLFKDLLQQTDPIEK